VRSAVASAKGAASGETPEQIELANLATCAEALLAAATAREESRGCHVREEFAEPSPEWRVRQLIRA